MDKDIMTYTEEAKQAYLCGSEKEARAMFIRVLQLTYQDEEFEDDIDEDYEEDCVNARAISSSFLGFINENKYYREDDYSSWRRALSSFDSAIYIFENKINFLLDNYINMVNKVYRHKGKLLMAKDKYSAAEPFLQEAIAITIAYKGINHKLTLKAYYDAGMLYYKMGNPDKMLEYFYAAFLISKNKKLKEYTKRNSRIMYYIGIAYTIKDDLFKAKYFLKKAYCLLQKTFEYLNRPKLNEYYLKTLLNLSNVEGLLGNNKKSLYYAKKATKNANKICTIGNPLLADCYIMASRLYEKAGEKEKAFNFAKKAVIANQMCPNANDKIDLEGVEIVERIFENKDIKQLLQKIINK